MYLMYNIMSTVFFFFSVNVMKFKGITPNNSHKQALGAQPELIKKFGYCVDLGYYVREMGKYVQYIRYE